MTMNNQSSLDFYTNNYFGELLAKDNINEIAYQKPHELWYQDNKGVWHLCKTELNEAIALSYASTLANNMNDVINENKPILSCMLPNGDRVQVTMPPSSKYTSITIRKPSRTHITFEMIKNSGAFDEIKTVDEEAISKTDKELRTFFEDKNWADFLSKSVEYGKNIVMVGETGSGKTTFMKSLIDFIPINERIITIEDVSEIVFHKHKNYVNLFYPDNAKPGDFLNAGVLLKSCLRMKPDRILLAELRGSEAYDFINILSSGHKGSITSLHAGSCLETFTRLALMIIQSEQGRAISFNRILKMLEGAINVVVHFTEIKGKRFITGVYFDLVDKHILKKLQE